MTSDMLVSYNIYRNNSYVETINLADLSRMYCGKMTPVVSEDLCSTLLLDS